MTDFSSFDRTEGWPWPKAKGARALVAMSGGVDSSFAAWALKRRGFETIGLYFKLEDADESGPVARRCGLCAELRDARLAAAKLGVRYYAVSLAQRFRDEVMLPFAQAYAQGLTPNPCMVCNPKIKWRTLVEKAAELDAEIIATGHHARIVHDPGAGRPRLLRGLDPKKDQSYFLAMVAPSQLERATLPTGWFKKDEARQAMRAAEIALVKKPESQDICFVGPEGYGVRVQELLGDRPPPPGEIVTRAGQILGRHQGIHLYTIGQRKGLMLDRGGPWYVVDLDPARNEVVVGAADDGLAGEARVGALNWIGDPPDSGEELEVKVRYRNPFAQARIFLEGDQARVVFQNPQRAVTPGQALVVYRGEETLGGGVILRDAAPAARRAGKAG